MKCHTHSVIFPINKMNRYSLQIVIKMKSIITRSGAYIATVGALLGCSPSGPAISYPSDAQLSAALEAQFASDRHNAAARDLIRTLGGESGRLRYHIRHVIHRQGSYDTRYDAVLVMGQSGTQSLQALFASMIPEAERAKLPQASLEAYEGWLRQQAQALQKTSEAQAQSLLNTLELLGKCYRDQKAGAEVTVMEGLGALVSPERNGWFAEKLALPDTVARCLPA